MSEKARDLQKFSSFVEEIDHSEIERIEVSFFEFSFFFDILTD
jgi:hypothetical protein